MGDGGLSPEACASSRDDAVKACLEAMVPQDTLYEVRLGMLSEADALCRKCFSNATMLCSGRRVYFEVGNTFETTYVDCYKRASIEAKLSIERRIEASNLGKGFLKSLDSVPADVGLCEEGLLEGGVVILPVLSRFPVSLSAKRRMMTLIAALIFQTSYSAVYVNVSDMALGSYSRATTEEVYSALAHWADWLIVDRLDVHTPFRLRDTLREAISYRSLQNKHTSVSIGTNVQNLRDSDRELVEELLKWPEVYLYDRV